MPDRATAGVMKNNATWFIIGFSTAALLGIVVIACLFMALTAGVRSDMIYHTTILPSGKTAKITMCNLVWGVEHSDRNASDDCFEIEYVMSEPHLDSVSRHNESVALFELIKPISDLWQINHALVVAFPTLQRKGTYYINSVDKQPDGTWIFKESKAKVHINDK